MSLQLFIPRIPSPLLNEAGLSPHTASPFLQPCQTYRNVVTIHLKLLLHAIPPSLLQSWGCPFSLNSQLLSKRWERLFSTGRLISPNLNRSDGNVEAFALNFNPLCQQGQVVIEEIVKPNLKKNINWHQTPWEVLLLSKTLTRQLDDDDDDDDLLEVKLGERGERPQEGRWQWGGDPWEASSSSLLLRVLSTKLFTPWEARQPSVGRHVEVSRGMESWGSKGCSTFANI